VNPGTVLQKYLARYTINVVRIFLTLKQVNAWNPKSIEEPDYDFILNGFTTAGDLIATFNEEQLLPILNNAVFFLLQV